MSSNPERESNTRAIWASLGLTKNLGSYESLRIDAGARLTVEDIDDEEEWNKLWRIVEAEVERKLLEANNELQS